MWSDTIFGSFALIGMTRLTQLDRAWLTVLICYCAVFGGILIYSDFPPYTFDAAAHPNVYTHYGAPPGLFAYVLYVLGIRTIHLQIAVIVFTIGVLGFWIAYRFLAEVSTRLYATMACLVLMTDYIGFAQWHVGLSDVWKMFLLFGGLYLAQRVAARKQAYPLLIVYAFHAFLFYYEKIFNVYVAAAVFLYFVFASRDYRSAVKFGLAQFAGMLTAFLITQLVLQFSGDAVRTSRNFAIDAASFLEAAKALYANHNIIFWPNFSEANLYRDVLGALRVLFEDHAAHTPSWSLVVLAFAAAEIVRRLRAGRTTALALQGPLADLFSGAGKLVARRQLLVKDAALLAPFLLVALTVALFYILASHPEIGAGFAPLSSFWLSELLPVLLGAVILAVTVAMFWEFWTFELWPVVRRAGIVVFAVLLRALTRVRKYFDSIHWEFCRLKESFEKIDWQSFRQKQSLDRINWELVIKDATLFARCVLVALSAAVFYSFASHPELGAGLASPLAFFEFLSIVIGIAAAAAIVFRRSMRMRALPKLNKFFARANSRLMIKDATIVALVFLVSTVTLFFLFSRPVLGHSMLIELGILCVGMVFFTPVALVAQSRRIVAAGAFVAVALAFVLVQPSLYTGISGLGLNRSAALAEFPVYRNGAALFVSAMLLLAAWHASGAVATRGRGSLPENASSRLLLVLAAMLVAYLLVYFLFTGYIFIGYSARYFSLTIFFNDLVLALGLVAIIDCMRAWYDRFKESTGWLRIARGCGAAAVAFGLAGVVVYWGSLQIFLLRRLPPEETSFLPILFAPPFHSTSAASAYGGTFA
jgi:hypothetical protein